MQALSGVDREIGCRAVGLQGLVGDVETVGSTV